MAVCDYELPSFGHLQCAALGLYKELTGAKDRNKILAYAYIGLGYGLKQFVPTSSLSLAVQPTEADFLKALQALASAPENAAFQIPWRILLPALFALLEENLSKQ